MATIYSETGKSQEAVEILRQGLKNNPGNLNLLSKMGILLAEGGRPEEAQVLLRECVSRDSQNPDYFNFLGVAHYRKGDFRAALDCYLKALELDANYASVFNNIGSLYLSVFIKTREEEAYKLALRNFNSGLRIDPRLFAAYNGRGAAYKMKGEVAKAVQDWKQVIRIKPDFVDAYFNIGISYLESGEKAEARHMFFQIKNKFYNRLPSSEKQRLERLIEETRK
jgi:tetratricopeptide (TPR) repeat protein